MTSLLEKDDLDLAFAIPFEKLRRTLIVVSGSLRNRHKPRKA